MFDVKQIQVLCAQLLVETDPIKIAELAATLREIVDSNVDKTRLKTEFVVRHFRVTEGEI